MAPIDPPAQPARAPGAQLEHEPAGLVRRACATAIDLACAALIGLAAQPLLRELFAAAGAHAEGGARADSLHTRLSWSLSFALPAWLALSILEALPGRAGPGKRAMGMRIEGPRPQEKPSLARVALRTAIKLLPWHIAALAFLFPTPWDPREPLERARFLLLFGSNLWLGIYLASAAMTRRRQSLHDLATGTVVLNSRAGRRGRDR
ncbi:MAG: RDD family protein [Planctomycetota bacterium]